MMSAMLRRLSDDWLRQTQFVGTMYAAANWSYVGNSKGYARCNGHYTDPHGQPKRLCVRALRDDAGDILRQRGELAACWQARVPTTGGTEVDKRSLYEELQKIPDHRRGPGYHGAIVHGTDGDHWQPASRPAVPFRVARPDDDPYQIFYYFSGIVWNGERFVAVGWGGESNLGTVVHSSDGDRWELAADHDHLADEPSRPSHDAASGSWPVSYLNGTIMYSRDGDRWERATEIATVDTLEDVAWGNGNFVAVGRNGTIAISP